MLKCSGLDLVLAVYIQQKTTYIEIYIDSGPPVVEIFIEIIIWIRSREIHAPVTQEHGLGSSRRAGTRARERESAGEVDCACH